MAAMEAGPQRSYRGTRSNGHVDGGSQRRAHHGNKRWVADGITGRGGTSTPHTGDADRWERGGHRGGSRGRGRGSRGKFNNTSISFRRNGAFDGTATGSEGEQSEIEEEHEVEEIDSNELELPEEREKFWQELVKARELERKRAIAEGKMDDPLQPKRLEDAITMVGTCEDMCPRFERYRRERENNLFEWETIPGTKRVDHKRAVKAYERAAGDKTLPSDLRPPEVLKRTLDYLFHNLLPEGGFSETFNFIRDRSRAVRTDFTMQHETGPIAIECHDRCARFHILALHIERDRQGFSIAMEEQQLMNTLQSLKEFYEDQRTRYQSPTELEMRVYHRLVHIRDQKERHDDIPQALLNHPVFELTTKFRARVQAKSAPISKTSALVVDGEAMDIFAELADVLRREGNVVMTYLVACILERHFGKDTIENIESIRGELSLSDVIDGYSGMVCHEQDADIDISVVDETEEQGEPPVHTPNKPLEPLQPSGTQWLTDTFGPRPTQSAFFKLDAAEKSSRPPMAPMQSVFSNLETVPNAFGTNSFGIKSVFSNVRTTSYPVPAFGRIKDDNAPAPSSFQNKVKEVSSTPVSFSTSAFSPFPPVSTPAPSQQTIFTPRTQPSQTAPLLPSQTNGLVSDTPRKTSSPSNSKPLNPLAPTFSPSSAHSTMPPGASGHHTATSSVFTITPTSSISTDGRGPSVSLFVPIEPSVSISQQPNEVQSTSDAAISAVPFVSSPPPMNSTSMEDVTDQGLPPPMDRRQPISLPPTPTASIYTPSSASQSRKLLPLSLKTSLSVQPTEILSPLILHSPAPRSTGSMMSLYHRESIPPPLKPVVSYSGTKEHPPAKKLNTSLASGSSPVEKPSLDVMEAMALNFERRSWPVKQAFSKWRRRINDQVKWIEACRRSERYKEKAQAERLSRSVGKPSAVTHTNPITSSKARTPLKKRLRVRLSGEYRPPANDEDLARRFEKNHEEHARRWARGSFLGVLKDFLESTRKPAPENWATWLSLNQESDGTAIWLEQKFNVPDSGKWRNESVFQIPMSKDDTHSYPGVVVFERTPLTGVTDILGRKFRVLEDCTRLREIIEVFPSNRHYIPTLLCIAWSERDPDSSKDFDDMVESLVEGGMLASVHELVISTAALDMEAKFEELLHIIPFDLDGRLVRRASLNDLFKIWEQPWEEVTRQWFGNCVVYGEFNWDLYAKLLQGCTRLLIQIIDSVTILFRDHGVPCDLPSLHLVKCMDSDATFDAVLDWLRALPSTKFTILLMDDVGAHRDLGRDFPTLTFLSQLYALAHSVTAHVANIDPEVTQFVSRSRWDDISKDVQQLKALFEEEMKTCQIAKLKPSKRQASFTETNSSRASTPRVKKQRVSLSDGTPTDEETTSPDLSSPPLSIATSVSADHPTIVTTAMLRLLTKDIRAKYGTAPGNPHSVSVSR